MNAKLSEFGAILKINYEINFVGDMALVQKNINKS